jgi:methylenetetrahydrofolate--tRNA-(uracil-5-)-methyltransferase
MRPDKTDSAHSTDLLAELVCSNSLKSQDPTSAAGTLKRELRSLGSLVIDVAHETMVPAGAALAVDRDTFARRVTERVSSHPLIRLVRSELSDLPEGRLIVATGPLTSDAMQTALSALVGEERLAFFDAAAPIIDAESVDCDIAFSASRYGKGGGEDYLNCPLTRDEYESFISELTHAQRVTPHDFEREKLFQACQPVEEIAFSSPDALRYGALKPVGLVDPRTSERPWAVVQLRSENAARTAFNLVGFQTSLTFGEQQRIFRMIPGLQDAEFLRYGVMHRNTFLDAPRLLDATLALRSQPRLRFAGQITGTEGYLEAAATGLLAAFNAVADTRGLGPFVLPSETALGALVAYATNPDTARYQPMHVNWGLVPPLDPPTGGKRNRYARYAARATDALQHALSRHPLTGAIAEVPVSSDV